MHPELIRLGPVVIPTYGVLLATGFVLALWLVRRRASRFGIEPDTAVDISIWILLAGLLGSKLLYVIVEGPRSLASPGALWDLVRSGGVFYGGFLGAVLAAVLLLRKRRVSFWSYADAAAPAVALGHAVGRLGCFSAGCCWGAECHLPWAVTFRNPVAHDLVGVPLNVPLHPTQLYESFSEFAIFAILYRQFGKAHRPGAILGLYLMLYSTARFIVEFFRYHEQGNLWGGPLDTSQWLSIALFLLGASHFVVTHRRQIAVPAHTR